MFVYHTWKKVKNDGNQNKYTCRSGEFFLWFWVGFGHFTSFLAVLRRFWPFNDGNQLPGCRLFSRYDIYIYINIYIYTSNLSYPITVYEIVWYIWQLDFLINNTLALMSWACDMFLLHTPRGDVKKGVVFGGAHHNMGGGEGRTTTFACFCLIQKPSKRVKKKPFNLCVLP